MPELRFRNRVIYFTVVLISILLLVNIVLLYNSSNVIKHQKELQEEAEKIRLTAVEMLRTIHLLDVGLRGFALNPEGNMLTPFDSAQVRKTRYLTILEQELSKQHFPMAKFYLFQDSVEAYFTIATQMKHHLNNNDSGEFMKLFKSDRGAMLVSVYRQFRNEVDAFEIDVINKAKANYDLAIFFMYWVQSIVFLICVPTLFYLAHYSVRTFRLMQELHNSEQERMRILADQNVELEKQVHIRTLELQAMNEEITSQNEEISAQNEEISSQIEQLVYQRDEIEKKHDELQLKHEELQIAQKVIEVQHGLIQRHNEDLVHEVDNQTEYLMRVNLELKERNSRLEQFTYVISHNLRGPLSRIQGLAAILDMSASYQEMLDIAKKMSTSTQDLDRVIKDLTAITEIRNIDYKALSNVKFKVVMDHVTQLFEKEIQECGARIISHFEVDALRSLPSYIESVFYNLISNSIKYRNPQRTLEISVRSYNEEDKVILTFTDNGLGIDLTKHGDNLFLPYKRFHFHVEGRGLGLYLVKTQIETLDGRLDVLSKPGEGTQVKISFRKS